MISVFGSLVDEDEIKNVTSVLESQWLGLGSKVNEFEEEFSKKYGVDHFTMVDSGSNALFMACKLLKLEPGSEVILPSYTWVSCAQAVVLAGLKPVFCDVDLRTMNVTAENISEKVTSQTGAVMVVHYAGLPVELDPIIELGFPIIEDAAHAVASKYKNQHCGSIGDIGIFSFDAVKNLTCGEGGGILVKDIELHKQARTLRYCGIGKSGFENAGLSKENGRWWEYNISENFIKMLPNNITASIGIGQLSKIDTLQEKRRKLWEHYSIKLSQIDDIQIPVGAPKHMIHSYFTYAISCKERDNLAKYLLENKIYTTLRYHPLHLNPIFKSMDVKLKNTELLNNTALSLPLHPRLTHEDVDFVCDKIKEFYCL